jgi:hypothetical protein
MRARPEGDLQNRSHPISNEMAVAREMAAAGLAQGHRRLSNKFVRSSQKPCYANPGWRLVRSESFGLQESGSGIGFSAQARFFALAAVARWPLTWPVADEPAIRPFGTSASL